MTLRKTVHLIFIFLWLFVLHSIAVFLFTDGFLLRRTVVLNSSRCEWEELTETKNAAGRKQCWMDSRFNRIVLVVIDSLRVDFALFDPHLLPSQTPYYINKLPIIHELLTAPAEENDAHIFRFIADPPTTTMQRLKGLTTGSLPTFIDAGDNFASSATAEDNWVKLARDHGLISVMLGDDTWLSLYPEHFKREFGYNPFDVKDLHTVDNGILKDLYSEMSKPDWSILLAHFEGVDHVGHRFGPDHPEMASKLSQMDGVLRKVVDMLDNSTLLFVMGDHGMTPNGDHGGDSIQEMNSVLFAYSKQPRLWPQAQTQDVRDVAQIDLVPTISLLMGLPIPFSNLGSIIPELFLYGNNPQQTLLQALHLNAHQLSRYLDTYSSISGDLPLGEFHELKADFEISERVFQSVMSDVSSKDSRPLQDQYLGYFQGVKAMCRSVWAKFDLVSMALGMLALVSSLVPVLFLLLPSNTASPSKLQCNASMWLSVLIGALFGAVCGLPLHFFLSMKPSERLTIFSCFGSAVGSVVGFVYFQYQASSLTSYVSVFQWRPSLDRLPNMDNIFATLILLIQCVGLLSNSYVLYEDSCISFFLISLYVIYFSVKAPRSIIFTNKGSKMTTNTTNWRYIIALCLSAMMAGVCCRTATYFQDCVEQKVGCERSSFLLPLSAAEPIIGTLKSARYILSCSCVALVPAALWLLFKRQGLLENFNPFHLCVSYGMPAVVVCVSMYWALQSLPAVTLDSLPDWQHVAIPRVIYAITGVILLVLLIRPVAVRARVSGFLPHLRAQSNSLTVELTGWDYVYVSPCLLLWVVVWLVLTLLQGDGLAPAMLLFALQAGLTVAMFSVFTPHSRDKAQRVTWSEVVIWTTLSYHYFYSTGHQPIFSDFYFDAAFVGFRGIVVGIVPLALTAFLVILNTFTSQSLCIVGLPALIFIKQGGLLPVKAVNAHKKTDEITGTAVRGPPRMPFDAESLQQATFRLLLQYILCHTVKLIGAAIMAYVLRRHLMVWKVFAPRYLFELASFVYGEILCLLMFIFVVLLDRTLRSWLEKISQNYSFFIY